MNDYYAPPERAIKPSDFIQVPPRPKKIYSLSPRTPDDQFGAVIQEARFNQDFLNNWDDEDVVAMSSRAWARATAFLLRGPNRVRIIDLYRFLDYSERRRGLSPEVALTARRMWVLLNALAGWSLDVPNAGQAMGGQLIFTWDRGEHHLELEMFPDAPSEFFYLNRRTNEDWAAYYTVGAELPEGLLEKLDLFTMHEP